MNIVDKFRAAAVKSGAKTIVYTHGPCVDGDTCARLLKKYCRRFVDEYRTYEHGVTKIRPEDVAGCIVFFADVLPPNIKELAAVALAVFCVDHHKAAADLLAELGWNPAACPITIDLDTTGKVCASMMLYRMLDPTPDFVSDFTFIRCMSIINLQDVGRFSEFTLEDMQIQQALSTPFTTAELVGYLTDRQRFLLRRIFRRLRRRIVGCKPASSSSGFVGESGNPDRQHPKLPIVADKPDGKSVAGFVRETGGVRCKPDIKTSSQPVDAKSSADSKTAAAVVIVVDKPKPASNTVRVPLDLMDVPFGLKSLAARGVRLLADRDKRAAAIVDVTNGLLTFGRRWYGYSCIYVEFKSFDFGCLSVLPGLLSTLYPDVELFIVRMPTETKLARPKQNFKLRRNLTSTVDLNTLARSTKKIGTNDCAGGGHPAASAIDVFADADGKFPAFLE